MKICMMSYSDINSGNATRILNLAKNVSKDFDVEIVFDGNEKNSIPEWFNDLDIKFTPYLKKLYLTLTNGVLYKLVRFMKGYDIIHCFKPLPSSFIPSFFISKVKDAKLVVDWDDWEGKRGLPNLTPFS